MNIIIDGKWINLDNVQTIQVSGGSIWFYFGVNETVEIDAMAPGVKSLWAWLQKAALVFDESTDAELEPKPIQNSWTETVRHSKENRKDVYSTDDRVLVDFGLDFDTGTITVVSEKHGEYFYTVQRSSGGMDYDVPHKYILGLAPPKSELTS